jgi:hypothetical protein
MRTYLHSFRSTGCENTVSVYSPAARKQLSRQTVEAILSFSDLLASSVEDGSSMRHRIDHFYNGSRPGERLYCTEETEKLRHLNIRQDFFCFYLNDISNWTISISICYSHLGPHGKLTSSQIVTFMCFWFFQARIFVMRMASMRGDCWAPDLSNSHRQECPLGSEIKINWRMFRSYSKLLSFAFFPPVHFAKVS